MAIDIIMTADEFIEKAKLAESTPSCYVTGCFGAPLDMSGVIERWETEYSKNKKYDSLMHERAALAIQQGTHCFGFDCVNLIKAILWGWDADGSKEYGGAKYQSGGVPDITVEGLFNYCTMTSTDFADIKPGAMLYYNNGSHCGIYIGDGFAIEATGSWDRKVYKTGVTNLSDNYPDVRTAPYKRKWQAWGLLPWINHTDKKELTQMIVESKIICPCCGATLDASVELTLKPVISYQEYVVKKSDTPWGIAQRFYGDGSKYTVIMDFNGLSRNADIHTGQVLKIPTI